MTLLPPSVPSLATLQVHFGGQRVCCGRHHHRKVWHVKAGCGATAAFRRLHICGQGGGKAGKRLPDAKQGSCRRWHGRGVEALLHPRGGQLARLGLDIGKRLQRRSERCGCGHQAVWAVVQAEGGTNSKEIGWPGSEGLSPQGGRGRTHGVSPRERRRYQNGVEASSWGASRLRPEEYNQWNCGFEELAFRRQALWRGWAEVEGCRIHVSFAGEKNTVALTIFFPHILASTIPDNFQPTKVLNRMLCQDQEWRAGSCPLRRWLHRAFEVEQEHHSWMNGRFYGQKQYIYIHIILNIKYDVYIYIY